MAPLNFCPGETPAKLSETLEPKTPNWSVERGDGDFLRFVYE
jgi:hypothetical protein